MSETPRRRGRPPKPDALTPAERMRRTRARAVAVLDQTAEAADLSDSALLELVRIAYRDNLSEVLAEAVTELFARMPKPFPVRMRPTFEDVRSETVTENKGATDAEGCGTGAETVTENIGAQSVASAHGESVTVAQKMPLITETVADNRAPSCDATERDRRIRALSAQGKSGRGIARELGIGETTVRRVLGRRKEAVTSESGNRRKGDSRQ